MTYGWTGDLVRLAPLDFDRHFANALLWVNDPEVTQHLLIGDFPTSKLAEEEWFKRMSMGTDTDVALAIETVEGEHIGFSGIHKISWRHGCAETGTMIGAKSLWGKGLGTDAARTRTKYCFEVLGLRLLLSGCLEGNERSLRMLTKVGYQQYGVLPKHLWKRGKYVDHILMCLHRENWTG